MVAYASPNAISAYHRMGLAADLIGVALAGHPRSSADPFDAAEAAACFATRWRAGSRCGWRCGPAGPSARPGPAAAPAG